jgi:hypothetical protein
MLSFTDFANLVADYIESEYDPIMGPSPYMTHEEKDTVNSILMYHYEVNDCNVSDAAGNIVDYLKEVVK